MLNLKRFMPTPAQALAGFLGAALIAVPAVAMKMHLNKRLEAMEVSNFVVLQAYSAWKESEHKDNTLLIPLFETAKEGNVTALILLSLAQRLGDPKLQIDDALIGFYRTAPEFMLGQISQLDYLYDPAKREPGVDFSSSLTADQASSLSQCAGRLQANAGRYEYMGLRDDGSALFTLKQNLAVMQIMIDELGFRDSVCNDLPV